MNHLVKTIKMIIEEVVAVVLIPVAIVLNEVYLLLKKKVVEQSFQVWYCHRSNASLQSHLRELDAIQNGRSEIWIVLISDSQDCFRSIPLSKSLK